MAHEAAITSYRPAAKPTKEVTSQKRTTNMESIIQTV